MLRQWLRRGAEQWLPAYAGGRIRGWRGVFLKLWLDHDAATREQLEQIEFARRELRRQPQEQPSGEVFARIQAAIATEARPVRTSRRPVAVWATAVVFALVALVLVWQALPPGISLEWSVEGALPQAFRVYRAPVAPDSPAASQPFTLLDELQTDEAAAAYQFTDWLTLPSQEYVYRVEALDQMGQPTASQTVIGRGVDALAGQLLTLAAICLLLASIVLIVRDSYIRGRHRSYPAYFQAMG